MLLVILLQFQNLKSRGGNFSNGIQLDELSKPLPSHAQWRRCHKPAAQHLDAISGHSILPWGLTYTLSLPTLRQIREPSKLSRKGIRWPLIRRRSCQRPYWALLQRQLYRKKSRNWSKAILNSNSHLYYKHLCVIE